MKFGMGFNSITSRFLRSFLIDLSVLISFIFVAQIFLIYIDKLKTVEKYKKEVVLNFYKANGSFLKYIRNGDFKEMENYERYIRKAINKEKGFIKYLESKKRDSTGVKILNYLSTEKHIFDIILISKETLSLIQDYADMVSSYLYEKDSEKKKRILKDINYTEEDIGNIVKKFYEISQKLSSWAIDTVIFLFWFSALFVIIILTYTSYKTISSITSPIRELIKIVRKISVGKLDIDIEIPKKDDEIKELFINIDKLLILQKNIIDIAKEISKENYSVEFKPRSKDDMLGIILIKMLNILKNNKKRIEIENWLNNGINKLNMILTTSEDLVTKGNDTLFHMCQYLGSVYGELYIKPDYDRDFFKQIAVYGGVKNDKQDSIDKGLIYEVAKNKKKLILKDVDLTNISIDTTIEMNRVTIAIIPLIYNSQIIGIIKFVFLKHISEVINRFIDDTIILISPSFFISLQKEKLEKLLEKTKHNNEMLEKQKEELKEAYVKLSNANQYKTEFLANVTHELKTPLNSIIVLSKLLLENKGGNLHQEDLKKLEVMNMASKELFSMINDLLEFARIETGKIDVSYEIVNSNILVKDMHTMFEPVAQEKGINFIVKDEYKGEFCSDQDKLITIIRNFLSNAFKFTNSGIVEFKIDKDEDYVIISVKDSGIGIAKDKLNIIFDPFIQSDGSIKRRHGGTGLGLSICKRYVKILGGKIKVRSEEDRGSQFIVKIPNNPNNCKKEELKEYEHIKQGVKKFDNQSVHLYMKNPEAIFLLSSELSKAGLKVSRSLTYEEAFEKVNNDKIDVLVVDENSYIDADSLKDKVSIVKYKGDLGKLEEEISMLLRS